jgi:hypothetical protein
MIKRTGDEMSGYVPGYDPDCVGDHIDSMIVSEQKCCHRSYLSTAPTAALNLSVIYLHPQSDDISNAGLNA